MFHLLAELFHTVWPVMAFVGIFPLMIFMIPLIFSQSLFSTVVVHSLLPAMGLVFIEHLLWSEFSRLDKRIPPPTSKKLLLLLGIQFTAIFLVWPGPDVYLQFGSFLSLMALTTTLFGITALVWYIFEIIVAVYKRYFSKKNHFFSKIPYFSKLRSLLIILVFFYPFYSTATLAIWMFADPVSHPQASRFAQLHAAIKNTCLTDPDQENCPQQLQDLAIIEPRKYKEALNCCQVNYQYDPWQNQYSFVVRYSPTQAVVFDQRLNAMYGIDLHEFSVSVIGQDRLVNEPDFAGPWTFEEWEYQGLDIKQLLKTNS